MALETWNGLGAQPSCESVPADRDTPVAGSAAGALLLRSLSRLITPVLLLAVGIFAAALLRLPIESITAHMPLNYNEGWNAFHTQRLMSGGPLYPPVSPGAFLNYPPLSFYVTGVLGKMIGDYVIAGRVLALLSLFAVAANVGLIARVLGVTSQLALLVSLIFLTFAVLFYGDYTATDDPQWFGHALQTSGLLLLIRRSAPGSANILTVRTLLAVALLLAAGGLVKQDLLALPLAVTIWLLIVDRRAFLSWLGIGAAIVVVVLAACILLYGQAFISQVLLAERNFSTLAFLNIVHFYAMRLIAYVAFAAVAVIVRPRDQRLWLLGIYLAFATVVGLATMTAVGVIYSALFDMTIAMMIGASVTTQWMGERLTGPAWRQDAGYAIAALLLVLPLRGGLEKAFDYSHQLSRGLVGAAQWDHAIKLIAAARGPVACESLALCYWAGRTSAIDFFNFGQYVVRHPDFGRPTYAAVADGEFGMIQMEFRGGSVRLPDALNAAIATRYGEAQSNPTVLLTPRP